MEIHLIKKLYLFDGEGLNSFVGSRSTSSLKACRSCSKGRSLKLSSSARADGRSSSSAWRLITLDSDMANAEFLAVTRRMKQAITPKSWMRIS